ncbi:interactor protein for cytohesin exchange factors 1 [Fundulus diaphanus]
MSQRHVTVKDLGDTDCQGWLQRRKDGRSFLGSKWKRYWFVLKKSCLYWYCDKTAEKAEGFINLSGFSIEQTKACRKKHVITASHPHVVTIFIAADSFMDMNKWISKLCEAAEPNEPVNAEECYSEDSDQDTDESGSTSCAMDSELDPAEPETAEDVQPLRGSLSCSPIPADTLTPDSRTRTSSATCGSAGETESLSWLDLSTPGGSSEAAGFPLLCVTEEREETPTDEMESLYRRLKAAWLSPIGQKDFRASFIRRSPNEQVNEKLHLLRILSSTLKAKELELQVVEQILDHPDLPAAAYRQWKRSNSILLEEIRRRGRPPGGATGLSAGESG